MTSSFLKPDLSWMEFFDHLAGYCLMTDDGTALGAALAAASECSGFDSKQAAHMFFGPECPAQEIQRGLQQFGLSFSREFHPQEHLVQRLSEGTVAAIFQGRMEFGPRALGHRSILSRATDPLINSELKARLRRTEFMPFAPITCVEDAEDCYIGLDGARHAAEFTTITCECTEKMRIQTCRRSRGWNCPTAIGPGSNRISTLPAFRR
jgi:carbamoyltransferase